MGDGIQRAAYRFRLTSQMNGEATERQWRCEDCSHALTARINPVECPVCVTGEMAEAPRIREA